MKKLSETAKNLTVKRALKRPCGDKDKADKEDGEPNMGDPNTAIVFWIIDPDDSSYKGSNGWM